MKLSANAWGWLWVLSAAACSPKAADVPGPPAGGSGGSSSANAGGDSNAGIGGSGAEVGGGGGSSEGGTHPGGEDGGASAGGGAGGSGGNPAEFPEGTDLNPGWIGGACAQASDCEFDGGQCLQQGYTDGFCTTECTVSNSGKYVCDDAELSAETLYTTSRCIENAEGDPTCVTECDFTKSPTGCRTGYGCVLRSRFGQADKVFPVCLPLPGGQWPGETPPSNDIGDACDHSSDCGYSACLAFPSGYCTKTMCEVTGCPVGSKCVVDQGGDLSACMKECENDDDCREGYQCSSEDDVCQPAPSNGDWDQSVGVSDCASVWPNGLSSCDPVPDYYVVIRKSARNVALCSEGTNLDNFNAGLGFAPTGDKEWQGDGKTPEGVFYVPRVVPNSKFYKAFLLSYPDAADAERGLSEGKITEAQYDQIVFAQASCDEPSQSTELGGYVELHGGDGGVDWTAGCIALGDTEIDDIWAVMGEGDTIVVLP